MPRRFTVSPMLIRAAQVAVLAGLAVLLWRVGDGWQALAMLRAADPYWLAAAALALTLQTLLSALRWRLTAARLGIAISRNDAVREYYLSQVVNQSLPGGVLGDAGRAVRARGQAGLFVSGQAVVFERIAGQIGLLAVLLAGLLASVFFPIGPGWPAGAMVPIWGVLIAAVCLFAAIAISLRAGPVSAHGLHRVMRAFIHSVAARDIWKQQAMLSLGTALCNVVAFAFCAAALGVAVPVLAVVTIVPLILFAMVLPLSIGGWGLREGAAAVLFPVFGAAMSEGLATSVAFGLVLLATVLPGMMLTWMRPNAPVTGRH
ncbi:lysylphosphatidylglycerol synthase transmembrane domain-containing protein [Rhodophyticola sp.]|uniref:lysylphosphatidylglycerol synthase transmembrane domain-containing protein n=1 Tax=Rhodophyticola sp. TaxID=2680032 RepID=UPI003D2C42D5